MMNLPRVKLLVGDHQIEAWVARTEEQRALGLMHRKELAPDEGMLFMCDEPQPQSFWMKDTPVALSIAFIEDDGGVVLIEDMEPHSLESTCCDHPVRYVLEVARGWFAERGIRAGARITGPVFLPAVATSDATSSTASA
jgi:uncharacterized membrane protein (UPF0127 family)